jgi:hypothetical protein
MKQLFLNLLLILSLNSFSQLTNSSFENWTSIGGSPFPTDWNGSSFGVDSTNDASAGNKALVVWTWYNYATGYVSNGNGMTGFGDFSNSGTAINQKPISLSGMYKFDTTNVGNYDSVLIVVFLKKYNTTTNQRDTVALGLKHLPAANTYTSFTVDVTDKMPGINPDSIIVIISSQRRIWEPIFATNTCRMPFMDCAYLTVDDLQLTLPTGTIEFSNLFSPSVFPNPTKDYLSFSYKSIPNNETETITIIDNTGKEYYKNKINSISNKLNVRTFGNGIFQYIIKSENNQILSKGNFIVE